MENEKFVNKAIVITSIFEPTAAIKKFAKLQDYKLYVVGDKKTPLNWNCENVNYISTDYQLKMNSKLANLLPFNHYCRKMLGYLEAIKSGSEFIIDTDDDNIPKQNWDFPNFDSEFDYINDNEGFVNIYELYTGMKIWPRGLPLNLINKNFELKNKIIKTNARVGIWQGLADEDPDVDAIYRLTSDNPCFFENREPVVLGKNTITPFNTQNTIIRKELFPLMYLPTYVTFRFTDILRGIVAQPIMWTKNYHLGFTNATVIQKRNPHDYMKDFISEIPMYQNIEKVYELLLNVVSTDKTIEANLYNSYLALLDKGIVKKEEIITLEAWLSDLENINA